MKIESIGFKNKSHKESELKFEIDTIELLSHITKEVARLDYNSKINYDLIKKLEERIELLEKNTEVKCKIVEHKQQP